MSARPWISWPGGPCPVAKGTLVDVEYRRALTSGVKVASRVPALTRPLGRPDGALAVDWSHDDSSGDIIAYRLSEDPNSEAETRAHRENLWRDWIKEAEHLADPIDPRKPVKVG